MLTLSNIIIKTSVKIISSIIRITHKIIHIISIPLKFIYKIIDKIILRLGYIFCSKIRNFTTKKINKSKFNLKNFKKIKKIVKKS